MRSLVRNFVFAYAKNNAGISETADWQSQDSYLWAGIAIFLGNLSKSLYRVATSSGKQGKQGKWSKKNPCREKSGNFEKKMKIREKSGNLFVFFNCKMSQNNDF